jgi:glycosyltransferase involved in cell wall biosynthesis
LKFLFIEPFFGGSHREFAEGLIENTHYRMDLMTLPARFWKWRMRGAALYFVKKCGSALSEYDGLITSDLMSLADFKALVPGTCPPSLVYFHESQLTYPLAPGEEMDYQFGFTDITTALAADRILFNSKTHRNAFFKALPEFLKMMPDYRPNWVMEAINAKAGVLYPGCRLPAAGALDPQQSKKAPPLVIWNHRWEFDKDPDTFFEVLDAVLKSGCDFRLALLGESARAVPKPFLSARDRFGKRVVQYGFVESRDDYIGWLKNGDITISTAIQENFGIATVEAIRYGCLPLLPRRLSYPEIIPGDCHGRVFYRDVADLVAKLRRRLNRLSAFQELRVSLAEAMKQYAWEHQIDRFDQELRKLAQGS